MASNFKILSRRSCDNLHLKLMGDFDGTSANEVVNAMRENGRAKCIFIHTTGLKEIHPFGKAIFERNLPVFKNLDTKIIFTGKHAGQFVSDLAGKEVGGIVNYLNRMITIVGKTALPSSGR